MLVRWEKKLDHLKSTRDDIREPIKQKVKESVINDIGFTID